MRLYLVRHAIAHDRDAKKWPDDGQRPLTKRGIQRFEQVAAGLRKLVPAARFDTRLHEGLPLLYVHPALVEQGLFNILENAAKFSPPGVPVAVAADLVDGQLRIDISDRGPGIPEEERRRVFDMFYTVARGDRGAQGTGLGLAICQGMMGAHGGIVEALPGRDGVGTTIRITLPLIEPPSGRPRDE